MIHLASNNSGSFLSTFEDVDVQPNAIDLRLDKIFAIENKLFIISETKKIHRESVMVPPNADGWWELPIGTYEVVMQGTVTIAPDEAGFVITRSTLNRNGVFLTSGLYDSGYSGVMAGALHVTTAPMIIKRGTRIGQFVLFKAEALHSYSGSYGKTSAHDVKYS